MKYYFILVYIGISSITHAQINDSSRAIIDNKYQETQEQNLARNFFEKEYVRKDYKRYNGNIIQLANGGFKFGKKVFYVHTDNKNFPLIFELGILNPGPMMVREDPYSRSYPDTLKDGRPSLESMFRGDTFMVENINEMIISQPAIIVKRFWCWFYRPGLYNPVVYLFELTNKMATKKTNLSDFIRGAKLTFCKEGWMIM